MVATVDNGLDYNDSRDYDDDGLDKEEATEKGPGARAGGMTTAGPKEDMETTQVDATTGKAKADKATNVGVEKEGDVDEGVHGLRHGMAALEAAMAVPGSTAACFAERARASRATDEEAATKHVVICRAIVDDQTGALGVALGPKAKERTYLAVLNAKSVFSVMHGLQWWGEAPSGACK